jgi:hypothetical protein
MLRRTRRVPVTVLVIKLAETSIVPLEGPHQDERDETNEEDHHHEGVEDGEPVDLGHTEGRMQTESENEREDESIEGAREATVYLVLEEALVEVLPETIVKGSAGLLPSHRIGELERRASLKYNRVLRGEVDLDNLQRPSI